MVDINEWNNIVKPNNVDVVAKQGDIVEKVNGVLFLLQTENEYNNVVAYRVEKNDKIIIWTLYEYCVKLFKDYGIEYIRVEGDKNKYNFIKNTFTKKEAVKDKKEKSRDVYYCNLKNSYQKMYLKCLEYDFYYNQNIFLTTANEKIKKESYEKMFIAVQFAVENAMKKRFGGLARKGVKRNDFYDMCMNATIDIMSRYKKPKGYKILYLLTTADYACLGALHNPRQKFMDSMLSLDSWTNYEYREEK